MSFTPGHDDTWDIATGLGTTALMVAAQRAAENARDDALVRDPFAKLLMAGAGPGIWQALLADGFVEKVSEVDVDAGTYFHHMGNYQAVRGHFFDGFLVEAATTGIRQFVILAAGLDSRAYRLQWPTDTAIFELDVPKVLDYKSSRLSAGGVVPSAIRVDVPVDLRSDWPTALCDSGFDRSAPTAWLAEGLLMYLPADAQDRLLERVSELSAPGTRIAAETLVSQPEARRAQMRERLAQLAAKFGMTQTVDVQGMMYDEPDRADVANWLRAQDWSASAVASHDEMRRLGRWILPADADDAFATFVTGERR